MESAMNMTTGGHEPASVIDQTWDVIVIGAGPAGALAARQLALAGRRVLLVDKRVFPRDKVCGACLNPQSLAVLEAVRLGGLVVELDGVPLNRFSLRAGSEVLDIPLEGSMALSRSAFDAALVVAAIAAGATFCPATEARVDPSTDNAASQRVVRLLPSGRDVGSVGAGVVLVADGLARTSVAGLTEFSGKATKASHIGVGATLSCDAEELSCGTIFMSVARSGYVGMVRVEDGRLNVAAAVAPQFVRDCGSVSAAVTACLREAGWSLSFGDDTDWHGTLPLTRSAARLASHRVLLLGDSAGYVEPFTGEGIAWALTSGVAVVASVEQGLLAWTAAVEADWGRTHRRLIRQRQRWCRTFAWCLRHPDLVKTVIGTLRRLPKVAMWLTQRVQNANADVVHGVESAPDEASRERT
jgi:menaquinone-9 beta-reductase